MGRSTVAAMGAAGGAALWCVHEPALDIEALLASGEGELVAALATCERRVFQIPCGCQDCVNRLSDSCRRTRGGGETREWTGQLRD